MPQINEYPIICEGCNRSFVYKRRNERGELVDLENRYHTFPKKDPSKLKTVCEYCWRNTGGEGPFAPDGKWEHSRRLYDVEELHEMVTSDAPTFPLGFPNNRSHAEVGDHLRFLVRINESEGEAETFEIVNLKPLDFKIVEVTLKHVGDPVPDDLTLMVSSQ